MTAGVTLALALLAGSVPPTPPAAPPPTAARTEYEITYHHLIRNKTDQDLKEVIVYLPVPPSDAYQQISDFHIDCDRPVQISNRTDEFGNKIKRIAVAPLKAKEELDVRFICVASLGPPVKADLQARPAPTPTLEDIPQEIRDRYTRNHNVLGLETPAIKEHAAALLKSHPDPRARAKAIHDFVASTIKYKAGGGWDPAPEVLARKSGSCSEFTYLFCALCRATGIPTRFIGASIFPVKSQAPFQDHGHHRWAQAFLPGVGWVDYDPTLDAGAPAKQGFVGTHHARTLVVTRSGDKSLQLGLSYLGSNSENDKTTRSMWFTWTTDGRAKLAAAVAAREAGDAIKYKALLQDLVKTQEGSRSARVAAALLAQLDAPPAIPPATR